MLKSNTNQYLFCRPAQAVKILIALAVYCTFGLQFYVCLDIAWIAIKDKFKKRPTLVNYTMRFVSPKNLNHPNKT